MSAEDRFDGSPLFPARESDLYDGLRELWEVTEAGYILHNGKYECGQCRTKLASSPGKVKHDDGCIQPILDKIAKGADNEVRDFAKAILHGDPIHREWLLEASEAFVSGRPMPPPRSAKPA